MTGRQRNTSGAPWEQRVGCTRAVRVNHIAVSGTTAVDREGRILSGDGMLVDMEADAILASPDKN